MQTFIKSFILSFFLSTALLAGAQSATQIDPGRIGWSMNPTATPDNVFPADRFSAADIGAKINAASAACTIGNGSCKVTLSPNVVYPPFNTTIVVPYQGLTTQSTGYFTLDCQGATLNYSGSGDAVLIPPKAVTGLLSGKLENCVIAATTTSARSLIHTQSSIGFKIENVSLIGNNTPVCLKQENVNNGGTAWSSSTTYGEGDFVSLGGVTYTSLTNLNVNHTPPNATYWNVYSVSSSNPIWTEEMEIGKVSMAGCVKGVQLVNNGGTDSFEYNNWHDLFFHPGPNQIGFSIEGAVNTIGSKLDATSNSYGTPGNQARIVSATGGAGGSFNTMTIRGESDGTTTDCAIYVDSTSFMVADASMIGSNFTNCYGAAAVSSQINTAKVQGGLTNLQGNPDTGTEVQAGTNNRTLPQAANCKWDLLNGTPALANSVFQVGSAVFGLANPTGFSGPNCVFEVYTRATTSAYPEVNVPGASGNPVTSALIIDSFTGNVGVGPGFGWNGSAWVLPAYQHHVVSNINSAFVTPEAVLDGALTAGNEVCSMIGRDTSVAKDVAQICFNYAGSGSNSNFVSFGFSTAADLFKVYADGHVVTSSTLDATGYKVSGTAGVSFTATLTNCTIVYTLGIATSHSGTACP